MHDQDPVLLTSFFPLTTQMWPHQGQELAFAVAFDKLEVNCHISFEDLSRHGNFFWTQKLNKLTLFLCMQTLLQYYWQIIVFLVLMDYANQEHNLYTYVVYRHVVSRYRNQKAWIYEFLLFKTGWGNKFLTTQTRVLQILKGRAFSICYFSWSQSRK